MRAAPRARGLQFREACSADVDAMFSVRTRTRENALSRTQLAARGITPASITTLLEGHTLRGQVCLHEDALRGFCLGDLTSGEVLVLAVLPDFERRGIGRQLLDAVVRQLRAAGQERVWLAASRDPAGRAFGFYRALGWTPTGEQDTAGNELHERVQIMAH